VVTRGGVFRLLSSMAGAAATWGLSGGMISITHLEPISSAALDALIDDAADVVRFLGLPGRPVIVKGTDGVSGVAADD
jgi:hypothetical protein